MVSAQSLCCVQLFMTPWTAEAKGFLHLGTGLRGPRCRNPLPCLPFFFFFKDVYGILFPGPGMDPGPWQ